MPRRTWATVSVAVEPEQRALMVQAAERCGLKLSSWARVVLMQAAYSLASPTLSAGTGPVFRMGPAVTTTGGGQAPCADG